MRSLGRLSVFLLIFVVFLPFYSYCYCVDDDGVGVFVVIVCTYFSCSFYYDSGSSVASFPSSFVYSQMERQIERNNLTDR